MASTSTSSSSPSPSTSSSSSSSSFSARMAERQQKLRALHQKRNETRGQNHAEVVEEDRRAKEPKNMEARKRRAEYLLQEEEMRKQCELQGKDFDRERLRHVGADEADAAEKKKHLKMDPDKGFSSFEAATARKHQQLTRQIQPDLERYQAAKAKAGDAFYAGAGTVVHGVHEDRKSAVDKMAEDVEKQVAKRDKYSRRRAHDEDADVDYINERNMKFNKKLERFYGTYTKDIKDNLERGTAV